MIYSKNLFVGQMRAELLRNINSTNVLPFIYEKVYGDYRKQNETILRIMHCDGQPRMPTLKAYWSTNAQYYHSLFGKIMSRNRFKSIFCFHFFIKKTSDKTHCLYKINQILRHILKNIQNTYYPGKNLPIEVLLL